MVLLQKSAISRTSASQSCSTTGSKHGAILTLYFLKYRRHVYTSKRTYHWGRGGEPEWAMHYWFNVLSWHTNHEDLSLSAVPWAWLAKLHATISPVKEAAMATHMLGLNFTMKSWAESLHGAYECHYAWLLPEANSTTVRNLTVPSVSSLPLSVMVRSCHGCIHMSCLRSRLLSCWHCTLALAHVQIWNVHVPSVSVRSICIWSHVSKHACSPASVGLAQAHPNYSTVCICRSLVYGVAWVFKNNDKMAIFVMYECLKKYVWLVNSS